MKLTHADSKQVLDVDPDHAETFQSQGWTEAPTAKPKDDDKS